MRNSRFTIIVVCSLVLIFPLMVFAGAKAVPEKAIKPLKLLPKDSNLVVVVDMQKVAGTKFYNKVKKDEESLEDYNEFIEKTGIDPQKDIDKIAISLTTYIEKDTGVVIIASGRFNKDKILSAIRDETEITVEDYQGKSIYMIQEKECEEDIELEEEMEMEEEEDEAEELVEEKIELEKKRKHKEFNLAFLENGLIAAGNQCLKTVIDLYQGRGESVVTNPALMEVVEEIDQDDMIWGAGLLPEKLKRQAPDHPMAQALSTISSVVFSVNIKKDLDALIKFKSETEESVKNLTDTLNGFIAMGRMSSAEKPDIMELLDGITVIGTGKMVSVSMHMSEDLMTRLSEKSHKKKLEKVDEEKPEKKEEKYPW